MLIISRYTFNSACRVNGNKLLIEVNILKTKSGNMYKRMILLRRKRVIDFEGLILKDARWVMYNRG